ncbi:MAG: hypothetical protein IIA67_11350, partial [Planctomycetes bacterium]|nr:hypothetical protein [Planctomycetota bacterium]
MLRSEREVANTREKLRLIEESVERLRNDAGDDEELRERLWLQPLQAGTTFALDFSLKRTSGPIPPNGDRPSEPGIPVPLLVAGGVLTV